VLQTMVSDGGYAGHISNLSFTNPPKHGDDLIVKVRREYEDQVWEKTDTVTMDTTEYWAAYVVPRMTLNPEDTVGIRDLENKINDYKLLAHPNPFNNSTTITAQGAEYGNVYDLNGKYLFDFEFGSNNKAILNFNNMPSGTYFVKPIDEDKIFNYKILPIFLIK